jgi:Rieske Fe-S protein
MKINRREFLLLTTTFVATRSSGEVIARFSDASERVVNAGLARNYSADGVYPTFAYQGFFIVRRNGKLFALSAVCTHKNCKLKPRPNHSFYCPCHGSSFDPDGHVKMGPAKRDLPLFPTTVDDLGQLLVTVPVGPKR